MRAFRRDCELGIDEGEIDNGAEPVALKRLRDEIAGELGGDKNRDCNPKRLAADATSSGVTISL